MAFAEIIHGRWVRVEVEGRSPQDALAKIRAMKFTGRIALTRAAQITDTKEEV